MGKGAERGLGLCGVWLLVPLQHSQHPIQGVHSPHEWGVNNQFRFNSQRRDNSEGFRYRVKLNAMEGLLCLYSSLVLGIENFMVLVAPGVLAFREH